MKSVASTPTHEKPTRTVQLWTEGGKSLNIRGESDALEIREYNHNARGGGKAPWRAASADEMRAVEIEEMAGRLVEQDVLCCDSMLVSKLLEGDGSLEGFTWEFDLENLYPNPSEWTRERCQDWLEDEGPGLNAVRDDREPTLDDWRQAVSDNAEAAEVYEWWRVTEFLCRELRDIGEVVLDNDYGYWWGRCCTGQSMIQDGTLQKVAARILNCN